MLNYMEYSLIDIIHFDATDTLYLVAVDRSGALQSVGAGPGGCLAKLQALPMARSRHKSYAPNFSLRSR